MLEPAGSLDRQGPVARIVGAADLAGGALPGAERVAVAAPDPVALGRLASVRAPGDLAPLYMRPPDARLPGGVAPEIAPA